MESILLLLLLKGTFWKIFWRVWKHQYWSVLLSQEHTVEISTVVLNLQGAIGSSVSAAAQTHQGLLQLPRQSFASTGEVCPCFPWQTVVMLCSNSCSPYCAITLGKIKEVRTFFWSKIVIIQEFKRLWVQSESVRIQILWLILSGNVTLLCQCIKM